jgi:hypothetical protein
MLTAAGSAYYHLAPDDARLFWDRLPMTLIFMSLLAATIGERIGARAGRRLLVPLLLAGAGSVLWWRYSDDLRAYGLVQFGAAIAITLILATRPPRYSRSRYVWWCVGLYGLAVIFDLLDIPLARVMPSGGHLWKHVAAASALLCYMHSVARRRPLTGRDPGCL